MMLRDAWQMAGRCLRFPFHPNVELSRPYRVEVGGKEAGRQGEKEAISLNKFKLQLEPDETAVRSLRGFFGDP